MTTTNVPGIDDREKASSPPPKVLTHMEDSDVADVGEAGVPPRFSLNHTFGGPCTKVGGVDGGLG